MASNSHLEHRPVKGTFYGRHKKNLLVPGFIIKIKTGHVYSREYTYVDYIDTKGNTIWRIKPLSTNGTGAILLLHRNTYGPDEELHQQTFSWGTSAGLKHLVDAIKAGEKYKPSPFKIKDGETIKVLAIKEVT